MPDDPLPVGPGPRFVKASGPEADSDSRESLWTRLGRRIKGSALRRYYARLLRRAWSETLRLRTLKAVPPALILFAVGWPLYWLEAGRRPAMDELTILVYFLLAPAGAVFLGGMLVNFIRAPKLLEHDLVHEKDRVIAGLQREIITLTPATLDLRIYAPYLITMKRNEHVIAFGLWNVEITNRAENSVSLRLSVETGWSDEKTDLDQRFRSPKQYPKLSRGDKREFHDAGLLKLVGADSAIVNLRGVIQTHNLDHAVLRVQAYDTISGTHVEQRVPTPFETFVTAALRDHPADVVPRP